MTCSMLFLAYSATWSPGRTPRAARKCARRLASASSSAYVRTRSPTRRAGLSGAASTACSNKSAMFKATRNTLEQVLICWPEWPQPGPELLPGLPVDRLPQQVRMAVVPGVLLDHVAQDPAQARRPAVGPRAPGELIEAAVGEGLSNQRAGTGCRVLPERHQLIGRLAGRGMPFPVAVGLPVNRVEWRLPVPPEQPHREPLVFDHRHVLEQPAQGHGRDADRRLQAGRIDARALPPQRRALPVEVSGEHAALVG